MIKIYKYLELLNKHIFSTPNKNTQNHKHTFLYTLFSYILHRLWFINFKCKRILYLKKNLLFYGKYQAQKKTHIQIQLPEVIYNDEKSNQVWNFHDFIYLLVQSLYFLILNIKIVKFDSNNHNHIQWLPFFHSFGSQCVLIYLEFIIKLRLSHPFYLCKSTTDLWDLLLNAIIYPYIYIKGRA